MSSRSLIRSDITNNHEIINLLVNKKFMIGPQGIAGPGTNNGTAPQMAYFTSSIDVQSFPSVEVQATTGQLLFENQTQGAQAPIIAFKNNTNTGIYTNSLVNDLAISIGGEENFVVNDTFVSAGSGSKSVDSREDLIGFRRMSSQKGLHWEDGILGNSNSIVFTANDFNVVNPSTYTPPPPSLTLPTAKAPTIIAGGTGTDLMDIAAHVPVLVDNATGDCFVASKVIPKGFKISIDVENFFISTPTTVKPWGDVTIFVRQIAGGTSSIQPTSLPPTNSSKGVTFTIGSNNTVAISTFGNLNGPSPLNKKPYGTGYSFVTIALKPAVTLDNNTGLIGVSIPIERI